MASPLADTILLKSVQKELSKVKKIYSLSRCDSQEVYFKSLSK